MENKTLTCRLCGAEAVLQHEKMKGYIEGSYFDVYSCSHCAASFSDPLRSDEKIYNFIYAQAERLPGYQRYARYAEIVKKATRPLDLLAESENIYWSIKQALESCFPNSGGVRVLELGSGLGYLTYCLNRAGYCTKGIDLSIEAVAKARQSYGDFFMAADIFDLAQGDHEKYDCVIMTELIEHVEDPARFVHTALSFLKANGRLILTTYNKDASPVGTLWQGDVPPVHLWWFSERSIRTLCESMGRTVRFIDCAPYAKKYYERAPATSLEQIESSLPRLDKNGRACGNRKRIGMKSRLTHTLLFARGNNLLRRLKKKNPSNRSTVMCAIVE